MSALAGRAAGPVAPRGLGDWPRRLLAGHGRSLAALLLLGQVAALVALVPPYLTKLVIDDGLLAGDRAALVRYSVALLAVGCGALLLGVASSFLHMRASVAMLARLRTELVAAVMRAPSGWRAGQQTGELLSRIDGDAGEVQRFVFNALLTGSGAIVRLAGALAMLFWIHWPLALLAVALAPLELAFLAWARPRTEALGRAQREARGRYAAQLAESLHGLDAVRQIGAGPAIGLRLGQSQGALNAHVLASHRFGELTRTVPALLAALARAGVFLAGGLMVIDGRLPLGSLIAFVAYVGFLIGPTQSLLGLWHAQARVRVAFERLEQLLAAGDGATARPEDPAAGPAPVGSPPPGHGPPAAPSVRWSGIVLAAGSGRRVGPFTGGVGAGEKVRLAGASGAGKSALLRAIQGLEPPAAGRLDIVDAAGDAWPPALRAGRIVHVPQRPFTLRASVAENLRLGAPPVDDDALREVLDLVGLTDRFAAGQGLATRLGEDGLSLSGGERQRLCLARALLRDAGLWLFDEALSEVDAERAREIWRQLDRRLAGRTRIVVGHDPRACGALDRTIGLDVAP